MINIKKNKKFIILSLIVIVLLIIGLASCGLVKVFVLVVNTPDLLHDYMLTAVEGAKELDAMPKATQVAGTTNITLTDETLDIQIDTAKKQLIIPDIFVPENTTDYVLNSYAIQMSGQDKAIQTPVDANGNLIVNFDQNTAAYLLNDEKSEEFSIGIMPLYSDTSASGATRATNQLDTINNLISSMEKQNWVFKKNLAKNTTYESEIYVQGFLVTPNASTIKLSQAGNIKVSSIFFSYKFKDPEDSCKEDTSVFKGYYYYYLNYIADGSNNFLKTRSNSDSDSGFSTEVKIRNFDINTGWNTTGNKNLKLSLQVNWSWIDSGVDNFWISKFYYPKEGGDLIYMSNYYYEKKFTVEP